MVEGVFVDSEIAALRSAVAEVSADDKRETFDRFLDAEWLEGRDKSYLRRTTNPAAAHKYFDRALRDPRVIRIASKFLGPNIRRLKGKINLKSAHVGPAVEWHQDWAFFPHTNDSILTLSIFIDDITEDNGPIFVIPGSHTGPVYDHHQDGRFVGVISPDTIRQHNGPLVPITGAAGAVSVHHVRIVHGSPANRSGLDRRMLVCPMVTADAWPLAGYQSPLENMYGEIIAGRHSYTPRMEQIQIRMPYPAVDGSLFEQQKSARSRYFD